MPRTDDCYHGQPSEGSCCGHIRMQHGRAAGRTSSDVIQQAWLLRSWLLLQPKNLKCVPASVSPSSSTRSFSRDMPRSLPDGSCSSSSLKAGSRAAFSWSSTQRELGTH
jgi:hypothetical protein